jgi:hypothetical protein
LKTVLLLIGGLSLAIPASGQALLDATLARAAKFVAPGSTVHLSGQLQNLGTYVIYLHGLSYTASETFTGEVSIAGFASLAPDSLLPGEAWEGTIAVIQVPPGPGTSTGHRLDFYVDGGIHRLDREVVAQVIYILDDSSAITAATDEALPRTLELRASPNPSRGSTRIDLALPREGTVDLRVFDVSGRSRCVLATGWLPAGRHTYTWDGRDPSGSALAPGTFFVRVRSDVGTRLLRLVRLQ